MNSSRDSVALGLFPSTEVGHQTVPSLWPVRGQITAGFGQRLDPFSGEGGFHPGVDIAALYGTKVQAPADGIVLQSAPGAWVWERNSYRPRIWNHDEVRTSE